ncbi:MAG: Fic family protein [Candidatus Dormibacteraeota bacterium]|nr:Fic family protein [Candidatus Dormibacteraeota bacterium]
MAKVTRRHWRGDMLAGLARRDRLGCEYEAYLPDRLSGRSFRLDGEVAADVADAEAAITRFNAQALSLVNSESVARLLLRAECVASSRIEGLEVGGRRLLRAELARSFGEEPEDVTAAEVLNNIGAMSFAIDALARGPAVRVEDLLEVHRRLLAGTRMEQHGGRLRSEQNWIGGSDFNPCSAEFVPPPPEEVAGLLEDLCAFCNDASLPAVAQAAIAHAQFETIHPFVDGNGRTGRALIHVVLRRRGLAPRVIPPVSLVLATWARDYVAGLTATRYRGAAGSPAAHQAVNGWVGLFAAACRRSVADAEGYEQRIRSLQTEWRGRLGRVRAGSAAELLIDALPGAPILTVSGATELIRRSGQAVNEAIGRLAEAGVLRQITVGRRNRAFEAGDLIEAFTDLERRLASPGGDTRSAPPTRAVPRHR